MTLLRFWSSRTTSLFRLWSKRPFQTAVLFSRPASGEEAISLLKSSASQYRAVVTDINLVGQLDGWEVARAARENEPAMPVIYMTGTHGEEWASKGVPNSVLLAKPFAPAQLVTAIANLHTVTPPAAPTE